ncbi:hypothetical protein BDU57DRAFT_541758 [Ampelomyces quisqualis]|uniref:Protein kinase domain-containing protein n=1 Tax=Ampelomyces quisqualis TaxID=50730 RepID=A0A6A5QCM2_AMPQU|nr:hypothetical protein BDU57DRAFT_541758 [Ampelomyces quisqualis]
MISAIYSLWVALVTAFWRTYNVLLSQGSDPATATPIDVACLPSEDSLGDKIGESFESSDFHEPTRLYLPESHVKRLITKEAIETHLGLFEEDLAAKLQGPLAKSYQQCEKYDRQYRTELAEWIHVNAPKIFAIVVQCDLNPIKLVLAMGLFKQHCFKDDRLPVTSLAKASDMFPGQIWNISKRRAFEHCQWQLLVPVFTPDKYDYDLEADCIFPFKLLKTLHKAGAFSSVYCVQIHKDHLLHGNLGDVAVKELKVPHSTNARVDSETAEANGVWEHEARALRAINKIDHPHVVKCIAAVRRGESRYFMFPWAEGDNLRDFWNKSPREAPSQKIILQAITQLLGIAGALADLHNYRDGRRRSLPGDGLNITVPTINVESADIPVASHFDEDTYNEDELDTPNSVSIRHGDLKPENLLRFTDDGDENGLGILKMADMGLAKQHVLLTSDRNAKRQITSTRYGTQPYEAPETVTAKYGRSRLYDIWSMGCITLEFVIWILYGNERLISFYDQIAGGSQLPYQYYEIPDPTEPTHAEVHRVVLRWMDHIASKDPECSEQSAIHDLLNLIQDKLLVVRLPPSSVSSRSGGRTLAPPALGRPAQFRATAEDFRDALQDILHKAQSSSYLFTGKDRTNAKPPASMLAPGTQRADATRANPAPTSVYSGVLGRPIRLDYSLPPLKDWEFPVDNHFARDVALRVGNANFLPDSKITSTLCKRCRKLDFWIGGFSLDDKISSLLISAQTCDFCKMLRDTRREEDAAATDHVRFERKESNLLLAGDPFPALSIVRMPGARISHLFQIGFPELLPPNTDAFFGILDLWLSDCDTNHKDSKDKDCNCTGIPKTRLPTRLIDVGTLEAPTLRLVETQEETISQHEDYIALSHPWGDTREYTPFSTLRKDPKETHHELDVFKRGIPYDELPATFRDAVICTRRLGARLGIRYLWIDSICIIQGNDGDFTDEAKFMEDVFSGASCVLAASRAKDQRDGFLSARKPRKYVTFQPENDQPFFVCEPIDNFNKDVIQGSLNRRGWVLQERALARRTIYFTETQTYFECGHGVRCETLARMHNHMADFLGDPCFPEKAMQDPSRALKIEYFQGLYKQYSRLDFTRYEDRPFAIAGLEKRLRDAFATNGGFGIFDDGDRSHSGNGLFHRSLLWKRSEEVREELQDGQKPVVDWLQPIDFPEERNITVPTWSWMAYKGAIDYMDPPYGTADWETKEIIPPWTKGHNTSVGSIPPSHDITLQVVVRDYNVAGSKPGEFKLVYDRERTTASDGRRAQCVVVAKSKEPGQEGAKRYFVLLVTATGKAGSEPNMYKRAGVGVMLGRFIALEGDGVVAQVM